MQETATKACQAEGFKERLAIALREAVKRGEERNKQGNKPPTREERKEKEVKRSKEKSEVWTLSHNTMDVENLERAMRRELEPIEEFFAEASLIWNRLGIRPVLLRAEEMQAKPYRFADLIFLSMTVPHWVTPPIIWKTALKPVTRPRKSSS